MPESFQLAEREASLLFSPKEWKLFKTNKSESVSTFVKVDLLAPLLLRSNISVSSSSSANDLSDNILASLPAELFTGGGVPFTPNIS